MVSIDPTHEQLLSLSQAAKLAWLPIRRGGRRPCVATLWRWCLQGSHGIRLESIVAGGVRCTTEAALRRFFDRLTEAAEPQIVAPEPKRFSRERQKQIEAAERRLAAAGI